MPVGEVEQRQRDEHERVRRDAERDPRGGRPARRAAAASRTRSPRTRRRPRTRRARSRPRAAATRSGSPAGARRSRPRRSRTRPPRARTPGCRRSARPSPRPTQVHAVQHQGGDHKRRAHAPGRQRQARRVRARDPEALIPEPSHMGRYGVRYGSHQERYSSGHPTTPEATMDVDLAKTALVLIEYQNDFTTEGGALHDAVKGVMDDSAHAGEHPGASSMRRARPAPPSSTRRSPSRPATASSETPTRCMVSSRA